MVKEAVFFSAGGSLSFDGPGGRCFLGWFCFERGRRRNRNSAKVTVFFPFHEKIMNVVLIFAFSERESCCVFIAAMS